MWGKGFRFKGVSWDGGEAEWRALVLGKPALLVDGGRRRREDAEGERKLG